MTGPPVLEEGGGTGHAYTLYPALPDADRMPREGYPGSTTACGRVYPDEPFADLAAATATHSRPPPDPGCDKAAGHPG